MTDFTSMFDKLDIPTTDDLKQLEQTMKDLGSFAEPNFDFDLSEVNPLPPLAATPWTKLR